MASEPNHSKLFLEVRATSRGILHVQSGKVGTATRRWDLPLAARCGVTLVMRCNAEMAEWSASQSIKSINRGTSRGATHVLTGSASPRAVGASPPAAPAFATMPAARCRLGDVMRAVTQRWLNGPRAPPLAHSAHAHAHDHGRSDQRPTRGSRDLSARCRPQQGGQQHAMRRLRQRLHRLRVDEVVVQPPRHPTSSLVSRRPFFAYFHSQYRLAT